VLVLVGVGVGVFVLVAVGVGVTVGGSGVFVGVTVGGSGVFVGVDVGPPVAVGVGVEVLVGVGVDVLVGVGVGVLVGVGVGNPIISIQIELLQVSVSATNFMYLYPWSTVTVWPVNSFVLLTFSPVLPVIGTQSVHPEVGHWYISKLVIYVLPVIVIVDENDICYKYYLIIFY
jgi:hypothetical protein